MDSMRKALLELDAQCDKLMNKLRGVDQDKKEILNENKLLHKEMEEVRKQLESQHKLQSSFSNLREENSRLASKIGYLEVSQLETEMRRHESEKKFLDRQVEQIKKEVDSANKELAETRSRQCELINENTSLRQGLAEAIKKAEQYRNQNVELAKTSDSLRADLEANIDQLNIFEDKIAELRSELAQKEKLASYLQSVVQPKQMQKLSRKTSSHTLISTVTKLFRFVNIEIESKQCEELEQRRNDMLNNLEHQRRVLSERQNEVVPLLKTRRPDEAVKTRGE
uniref:Uncharacterized protein n=1 Tax=Ditylenchus dipsaci TaxID=166011 RepID=A0A915DEP7_9BILA